MPESNTEVEVREKLLAAIGAAAEYKSEIRKDGNPEGLLQLAQAFALVAKGPTKGAVV